MRQSIEYQQVLSTDRAYFPAICQCIIQPYEPHGLLSPHDSEKKSCNRGVHSCGAARREKLGCVPGPQLSHKAVLDGGIHW